MSSLPVTHYSPSPVGKTCFSRIKGYVSETEYWEKYYEAETAYEWNNGVLEEKPVSDWQTSQVYHWFLKLLSAYLETYPIAEITLLDIGFRLTLPNKKVAIRKPDMGVVRNDNPVGIHLLDRSYRGIFDLCVEALSDSTPAEALRDTVVKKEQYAAAKVKEYFILHEQTQYQAFYFLDENGVYQPLPATDGIIRSRVLPGFQFRLVDLSKRPAIRALRDDEVYREFAAPEWRAAEAEIARLSTLLAQQG